MRFQRANSPEVPIVFKVKTTFAPAIAANFTALNPNRVDANATTGYSGLSGQPADPDSDFDAVGGSFFGAASFTKTNLGQDQAANGGLGELIATEVWDLNGAFDHLDLYVKGAQYYDFDNPAMNFHAFFQTVVTSGVDPVPEPAGAAAWVLCVSPLRRSRARRDRD